MADTNTKTYHEQLYIDDTLRLREILKTLPPFAKDYFRAVEPQTSTRTRISYAYDIRVFFHFLMENNPVYRQYSVDQFTVQDLERIEPIDIEEGLQKSGGKTDYQCRKGIIPQNVRAEELLRIFFQAPGHF